MSVREAYPGQLSPSTRPAPPPAAPAATDETRQLAPEYLVQPSTLSLLAAAAMRDVPDVLAVGVPRLEEAWAADLDLLIPYLEGRLAGMRREQILRDRAEQAHRKVDAEIEGAKREYKWSGGDGRGPKRDDTPEEARQRRAQHAEIDAKLQRGLAAAADWSFNDSMFRRHHRRDGLWRDTAAKVTLDGSFLRVGVALALGQHVLPAARIRALGTADYDFLILIVDQDLTKPVSDELARLCSFRPVRLGADFERFQKARAVPTIPVTEEL